MRIRRIGAGKRTHRSAALVFLCPQLSSAKSATLQCRYDRDSKQSRAAKRDAARAADDSDVAPRCFTPHSYLRRHWIDRPFILVDSATSDASWWWFATPGRAACLCRHSGSRNLASSPTAKINCVTAIPKHRWLQFSLRTLLLTVAAACASCEVAIRAGPNGFVCLAAAVLLFAGGVCGVAVS